MPKWLQSFLILMILLIPSPAYSQDIPRLSTLEVDLWPEYDRLSVLVIYRITLPAETTLPVNLALRIPAAAGEPNAVAVRQPDGQLFSVDYTTENSGDWQIITFIATLREVQIEYYDPGLQQDGNQRSFTFSWSGDYDIDQMVMQVQLPVGGADMRITPGPVSSQVLGDGMTYYFKEIGSVTTGQSFSIDLTYQKESTLLSVESLQVQPSAPLSPTNTWRDQLQAALPWLFPKDGSSNQVLPWALGILALVLIFGGGYWYWRSGREEPLPKRTRGRRSSPPAASPPTTEADGVYCHQCGKRANPGDAFCRSCGTRLRAE
jgi:hypothetical protein